MDIHKRVIAIRPFHIDKVEHTHLVAFGFEQTARISQQLSFRIEADEGGITLHQIWLRVEPRLACATTAHDDGIEISSVQLGVVPDRQVLREYLVGVLRLLLIPLVYLLDLSPFGRAVFLTAAKVWLGIVINQYRKTVDE